VTATTKNAAATPADDIPWRVQLPIYMAGSFSNGSLHLAAVIIPLWMLQIDPSPLLIGIALGARQVLPVLFSIHGGALMDRLGIRRVMLWFSIVGVVTPLLYPALPFLWAVLLLQMLSGISATMGWIGTQAQIGALMNGAPKYAGRVTFCNRFGTLIGPPATGLAWDLGGPWAGFGFLSFWGLALLVACVIMPKPENGMGSKDEPAPEVTWRDAIPRGADYIEAFKLLGIPAIMFVMALTLLHHSANGIATSFYVVWLKSIGMQGTTIGILVSAASILGSVGSLSAGWAAKRFSTYRVLIASVGGAMLLVCITPLLGSFVLLLIASMLRGGFMGMTQPLLISLLVQAAPESRGKAVGLRTSVNRIAILLIPILMGAVAEVFGIAASFYVIGGLLGLTLIAVAYKYRNTFP
jgi:MFS family permease